MNWTLIFCLFFTTHAQAQLSPKNLYLKGYAEKAFQTYSESATAAEQLSTVIDAFLANPTQQSMDLAKKEWINARKIYLQTEMYRFFDSPIDDVDGPEGMINAWPIDEAYIDSVVLKPKTGIINDPIHYPTIDRELLISLNAKDGENNISTGWHAIEFLLWGQDRNLDGPGNRPFTDYVLGGGKNEDRRRTYLKVVTDLLVEQIQSVARDWNPSSPTSYFHEFIAMPDAIDKILKSAIYFSGNEISVERMYTAYDSQSQEDEQSCFSDTTHQDLYYDFLGLHGMILDSYSGVTFVSLVAEKDPALAKQLADEVNNVTLLLSKFPAPFDTAIFDIVDVKNADGTTGSADGPRRVYIKNIIDQMQTFSETLSTAQGLIQ